MIISLLKKTLIKGLSNVLQIKLTKDYQTHTGVGKGIYKECHPSSWSRGCVGDSIIEVDILSIKIVCFFQSSFLLTELRDQTARMPVQCLTVLNVHYQTWYAFDK